MHFLYLLFPEVYLELSIIIFIISTVFLYVALSVYFVYMYLRKINYKAECRFYSDSIKIQEGLFYLLLFLWQYIFVCFVGVMPYQEQVTIARRDGGRRQ